MPRTRKYLDNAEKQAAYRQRLRNAKLAAKHDRVLDRMQKEIRSAALSGDALAILLLGANAKETVSNIASHFEQFNDAIIDAKFRKGL